MNARQKRLFEESHKKNPSLKIPTEKISSKELTESDMALLKQGVGDKTSRPSSGQPQVSADVALHRRHGTGGVQPQVRVVGR